jgi:hypothetical protein
MGLFLLVSLVFPFALGFYLFGRFLSPQANSVMTVGLTFWGRSFFCRQFLL